MQLQKIVIKEVEKNMIKMRIRKKIAEIRMKRMKMIEIIVYQCNWCGKYGHIKKKCWQLHPELFSKRKSQYKTQLIRRYDSGKDRHMTNQIMLNGRLGPLEVKPVIFIDTGSAISCINQEVLLNSFTDRQKHEWCKVRPATDDEEVTSANNTSLEIIGKVELPLVLGLPIDNSQNVVFVDFRIVRNFNARIIIGMDYIPKLIKLIDFEK